MGERERVGVRVRVREGVRESLVTVVMRRWRFRLALPSRTRRPALRRWLLRRLALVDDKVMMPC